MYRNTEGTLNYQNRVHKFSISFTPNNDGSKSKTAEPNLQLKYIDSVLLTGPDGTPTTGLDPDFTGSITYPGFPDLPVATYEGDGFGRPGSGGKRISLDTEGLVLGNDGSFWISDEYGPYIYQFSNDGKMKRAIRPPEAVIPRRNNTVSFNAASPPTYDAERVISPEDPESGRANNQGLEGLTVSADGKTLYALLQSALTQEGGPDDGTRGQARLLEYSIPRSNKNSKPEYRAEYVVSLPTYTSKKGNKRFAAQSEIFSLGHSQFFILARDSGAGRGQDDTKSLYRQIDVFDTSRATNIKSRANDAATGAIATDEDGVLKPGITPVEYCPFIDINDNDQLATFGLRNGGEQSEGLLNEKWESIALAPVDGKEGRDGEWFVFTVSDNDFITQDGALAGGTLPYKDGSGFDLDSQALVFRVKLPRGVDVP